MNKSGFTLIEILVSVGIVAVISAIGITQFGYYKDNVYMSSTKQTVQNLITAVTAKELDVSSNEFTLLSYNLPYGSNVASFTDSHNSSNNSTDIATVLPGFKLTDGFIYNIYYQSTVWGSNTSKYLNVYASNCYMVPRAEGRTFYQKSIFDNWGSLNTIVEDDQYYPGTATSCPNGD